MSIELLRPPKNSVKKRSRVGRGPGSGSGKTSGRGHRGQNSRKGGGVRLGFEGGQTPLYRRLPKRGFKNFHFKKNYNEVNVYILNQFEDGAVVDRELLDKAGLIPLSRSGVKILGNGDLNKKLEVHADVFSKSAREKIEKAGGKVVELNKN
ncbi:MAG TPA: 50S ribosomal protein L15 [Spirochaetota bacterium]|nr:50S ribosomal protein L15 [Spirochaetota bacterium]HOS32994.1 50S ribosomal protein L15 [Spirochaetota bacterium]HOS55049.1 50S ribosomal protein L15 [Spirochaetota bacterium]HPK62500.1 50S ribosomal protein L15 [Spirochaetota bacterium]HQF77711.1 50S ribosomal protein L15 [Spirochaetota bacterium]